jgi:hypothetical protein
MLKVDRHREPADRVALLIGTPFFVVFGCAVGQDRPQADHPRRLPDRRADLLPALHLRSPTREPGARARAQPAAPVQVVAARAASVNYSNGRRRARHRAHRRVGGAASPIARPNFGRFAGALAGAGSSRALPEGRHPRWTTAAGRRLLTVLVIW